MRTEGKLTNADGEFIASGPCEVDRERGEVTMWPSWELHMLERQRGPLALELADGSTLDISDRHLTFKLAGPTEQRISVYRLRISERVPEHLAAGYREPEPAAPADDPAPAATPPVLRIIGGRESEGGGRP
ncbi:MAG TPA: hypothetical protein VFC53_11595 [Dehalococcoidia bacterium]|nr:hypothetical protein [Dehalococcoidia bacterium]